MLRQLTSVVFAGGFTRLGQVQKRMAKHFPVPVVDELMEEGVIRPKTTPKAMCILSTACVPESDEHIDLREFQSGATHAVHEALVQLYSPSMLDFAANGHSESCDANEYFKAVCSDHLYKKLFNFAAKMGKNTVGVVSVDGVAPCAIVDGSFEESDEDGEFVTFVVNCSSPYTKHVKEETAHELEQRIVAASSEDPTKQGPTAEEDQPEVEEGVLKVVATFKSLLPSSGELDWTLQELRIAAVKGGKPAVA
ncbi:Aste57867_21699 [Aphanomyces stellatus]|uniref:Aste57867_21699 protein n=1 Tax=Aphanomyces stellatus TaxID=120398 RepID=A0A485LI81_9STRA|nr:hypothetical protein As57867_021630 [Aphanomyces stellatus]VFT98368.1 Aste57867_21699 [Aphanomyces stellatus]